MKRHVRSMPGKVRSTLHVVSVTGVYMVWFGGLFLLQMLTIGLIPWFQNTMVIDVPIGVLIFILTTLFVLFKFVEISSPYK